jgi:hypothetical protein
MIALPDHPYHQYMQKKPFLTRIIIHVVSNRKERKKGLFILYDCPCTISLMKATTE